jgi:hypothetical protein
MAESEELKIDLEINDRYDGLANPVGPRGSQYPQVSLETKQGIDLPDAGYVTFKFKKKEHTERTGEKPYFCTVLELLELCEVEAEESEEETDDLDLRGDEALDKLAAAKQKEIDKAKEED